MTRARALKSVIRARVAKTGERYTTARRHVLAPICSRRLEFLSLDSRRRPLHRGGALNQGWFV